MAKLLNILAIFAFSLAVAFYAALLRTGPDEPLVVHFDAPVWIALQSFVAQWLTLKCYQLLSKGQGLSPRPSHYIKVYLVSAIAFALLMSIATLPIEIAAGLQHIDGYHLLLSIATNLALHLMVGGVTLVLKVLDNHQQQAVALEREKKLALERQVALLQAQLDPHFLFNNLNVLSALISKDPDEAEEFLHTFCDIYRYVLENRERPLVPLHQELDFARDYMALLDIRFNGAYRLELPDFTDDAAALSQLLPPCTLQLTLENAVKHNQGDSTAPLPIRVQIREGEIQIRNPMREKAFKPASSGLGLANLSARSLSLCGRDIRVTKDNGEFCIAIPLQNAATAKVQSSAEPKTATTTHTTNRPAA
ncbi:sensor histidine kinase [Shewanella khirikhana]|nr:histidine kinase [Shewanella khirikhana]